MLVGDDVYMEDANEEEQEGEDIIIVHMDIREPLVNLQ